MTTISVPAQAAVSESSQNTPTNSTSVLVVHKGNESTTLLFYTVSKDHWIVDTGASNHMIRLQDRFFLLGKLWY